MKKCFQFLMGLSLGLSTFIPSVWAEWSEIGLQSNYTFVREALTTEKVWTLDPDQINPHLQRWTLQKKTQLLGLQAYSKPNHKFGVKGETVLSIGQGYIRSQGPWFQTLDDFPCSKSPVAWFETQEGAKEALSFAAELWAEELKEEKVKLSVLLERVSEKTPEKAVKRGNDIFNNWIGGVDLRWRRSTPQRVRQKEWQRYWEDAKASELCTRAKPARKAVPSWKSMMEPLTGQPPKITQLLARAPAKRWDGLFSIRLDIQVGKKTLNGQFLIDSGAKRSILSPLWLESQGVIASLITVPGAVPERITWSGAWETESSLSPWVSVDQVKLGGLVLPLTDFLLAETEFFAPPESVSTCCDGILGLDFLKLYPVEFNINVPYEVRVWPKEGFQWSSDTPWTEEFESSRGLFVNSCFSFPEGMYQAGKFKKGKVPYLPGILFETGSEESFMIHTPWQSFAKSQGSKRSKDIWNLQCDTLKYAENIEPSYPHPFEKGEDKSSFNLRIPAASVGMGLLGRGNFTFDLPHGRLWFSKDIFHLPAPRKNESGLKLKYVFKEADRVLKVSQIAKNSFASSLSKAGLKPGMTITQIDSKDVGGLDQWEVDQRLAGTYGSVVTLQWETKKGEKTAPLQLKSASE